MSRVSHMRHAIRWTVLLLTLGATVATCAQNADAPFRVEAITEFNEPWAMTFLPDGQLLVTEKPGELFLVSREGAKSAALGGVPDVAYGGQGGLGDVILHPDYVRNGLVYLSYAESGPGDVRGAAVARARLVIPATGQDGRLEDVQLIWRQHPKVTGSGHYGHRMAFSPDGFLFITSGERQKFTPAQDMTGNLGKIVRLRDDGSVPADNPFTGQGEIAAQVWSLGHRNLLGLAFDANGRLWNHEMGPRHGDELNLVARGANYGYPVVSEGDHYSGDPIPNHDTHPEFQAPKIAWTPTVAPAGLVFYSGDLFPQWQGSALIGGLASRALIRVEIDGDTAREAERFDMGKRIREVEQGPDGYLWLLEDGPGGRLLKLTPRQQKP